MSKLEYDYSRPILSKKLWGQHNEAVAVACSVESGIFKSNCLCLFKEQWLCVFEYAFCQIGDFKKSKLKTANRRICTFQKH